MKHGTLLNYSISAALLILVSPKAFAITHSLKSTADQVQVSLESVPDNANLYYLRVENLDSPMSGRPLVVKRTLDGSVEEFSISNLEFKVRMGGSSADPSAKPPVVGVLTFKNANLKLSTSDKPVNLADMYANAECLRAPAKNDAERWHKESLALVKETCGTAPIVAVDWASFVKVNKPGLACNAREVLLALNDLCREPDFKKSVAALKTLTIRYGSPGSLKKSGASVIYTIPALPENTRLQAMTFFKNNL